MRALRESSAIASADRLVRLVERARARGDKERARHKAERTNSPRTLRLGSVLAILAAVAVVGVMAGASYAMVLSQQAVSQEASEYGLTSSASPNFLAAPTVALGSSPGACSTGSPWAYPAGTGSNEVLVVVSGVTGASACASSDAAEVFTWLSPSTLTGETARFVAYVAIGTPAVAYIVYANLTVTGGAVPSGYTSTFEWVLDLGSAGAPPAIDSLAVTVT